MKAVSPEESSLRVVISVPGVFFHFDLAKELHSYGYLERIFSTFPWARLKRESVPREMVRTFPLIHPAQMVMSRYGIHPPPSINHMLNLANVVMFDSWVSRRVPACDAFVALSSCGLVTGKRVQARGGKYVCDRGSTHIRFQDRIVSEENRRWGVEAVVCDPKMIAREEAEYAQADAIAVPSEFSRRSFLEMGVPGSKVHKITYGVNLERFTPVAEPNKDCFEVLFVGQVSLRKGIPYLLQAFAKFPHPQKRLRIVGTVADEIRPFLARESLDGVELVGTVPQARLAQIMSSSHVLVLPSIEEGLALVQGQAMACGCPLISSTNTGGSDLFTDGVEGFEVPIRSADAITEKLVQLADEPQLQLKMRAAAVERVRALGGWKEYGETYVSFLKQLIAG